MNGSAHEMELPGRLDIHSAREQVLSDVGPLGPVEVALEHAAGRVSAGPVTAPSDMPAFDASAMDGFAIRSRDLAGIGGVKLEVVGESSAGSPWTGSLGPGQAVAISTGAEVPADADTVVRVEDTRNAPGKVIVEVTLEPGENVRRRGDIMAAGTEVLAAGSRIGPVELGLLASTGKDPVPCSRRPAVAIIATGDELVAPGEPLGPGQVWNSNLTVISAMVSGAGGEIASAVTIGDTFEQSRAAIDVALDCELTVICGGVSVGEHDHVRGALGELAVEQRFWGLAMRPGRPAFFGSRGDSRVLGLPGNPVSAMAVFALLGTPLLKALSGGSSAGDTGCGRLLSPVRRLPDRLFAAPCRIRAGAGGVGLEPIAVKGSHDFISLAGARALALIEAGDGEAAVGEEVEMVALVAE